MESPAPQTEIALLAQSVSHLSKSFEEEKGYRKEQDTRQREMNKAILDNFDKMTEAIIEIKDSQKLMDTLQVEINQSNYRHESSAQEFKIIEDDIKQINRVLIDPELFSDVKRDVNEMKTQVTLFSDLASDWKHAKFTFIGIFILGLVGAVFGYMGEAKYKTENSNKIVEATDKQTATLKEQNMINKNLADELRRQRESK